MCGFPRSFAVILTVYLGVASHVHGTTVIDVPENDWEWLITLQPVDPLGDPTGSPGTGTAAGSATIRFDSLGLFDFGDLNDPNVGQNPLPPGPLGGIIEIEIVELSLTGNSPILGGQFEIGLDPNRPSVGTIENLTNTGGVLTGDVNFAVWCEVDLITAGMTLLAGSDPISLSRTFTTLDGVPADDSLWMPFFLWQTITVNTPELVDQFGVPWDTVIEVHTEIPGMAWVPEPCAATLALCGLIGLLGCDRRWRLRGLKDRD